MRYSFIVIFLLFVSILPSLRASSNGTYAKKEGDAHRLLDPNALSVSRIIEVRFTPLVQQRIEQYTTTQKAYTAELFTRASEYFPVIEQYLAKYNMPNELKYLAVVESKLRPAARSSAGALGMWQLMSPTAKELGLRK